MPIKTWVVGEEVLAADFNTYVQTQVVARFATAAARDAAWPAATAGPGAISVTTDTGIIWQVVGAAWVYAAAPRTAGFAQATALSQGGIVTATDITGLTTTFTALAGRKYKITAELFLGAGVGGAGEQAAMSIRDGAGSQLQSTFEQFWTAGLYYKQHCEVVVSPAAGSYTVKVSVARVAGTTSYTALGNATSPAFILVEDIT